MFWENTQADKLLKSAEGNAENSIPGPFSSMGQGAEFIQYV